MSHDPSKPAWPGQQPSSFDPYTGKPIYAAPPQQPQQPQYGQQPGYPQQPQAPQQWQQPQQPQYPQQPQQPQQQWGQPQAPQQQPYGSQPFQGQQPGYPQQPQQPQYPQQPQQPQQWGQQPQQQQQPWGGQQPSGYPQAPNMGQFGFGGPSAVPDHDDDDDEDGGLRGTANATVNASDRLRFIRMTYIHLMGAIAVFAGLLWCFFKVDFLVTKVTIPIARFAIGIEQPVPRWHWGVVLAVFMAVSWVADYWASHTTSRPLQYVGLALYVLAEALIFIPLLLIVMVVSANIVRKGGGDPNILRDAAFTTLGIFGALTATVLLTKKDFSFLRGALAVGGGAAMMLIVLSLAFGFNLGIIFAVGMVVLAAGYILYQTSQVLAHYHTENYVAAALALFSSIALMFWYIIQIFMRARSND